MADITGAAAAGAAATGWAATATSITMALLGVDHRALIYGLVGALLAQFVAERMARGLAMLYVGLSTVAGAAIGSGAVAVLGLQGRFSLFIGCLVGGFGAPRLLAAGLKAATKKIEPAENDPNH